jgi:hypothetical protein
MTFPSTCRFMWWLSRARSIDFHVNYVQPGTLELPSSIVFVGTGWGFSLGRESSDTEWPQVFLHVEDSESGVERERGTCVCASVWHVWGVCLFGWQCMCVGVYLTRVGCVWCSMCVWHLCMCVWLCVAFVCVCDMCVCDTCGMSVCMFVYIYIYICVCVNVVCVRVWGMACGGNKCACMGDGVTECIWETTWEENRAIHKHTVHLRHTEMRVWESDTRTQGEMMCMNMCVDMRVRVWWTCMSAGIEIIICVWYDPSGWNTHTHTCERHVWERMGASNSHM